MKKIIFTCLMLCGCGGRSVLPPPAPIIQTQVVHVATPVACPALAKLGPEPTYDDNAAALAAAPDIFEQVRLLLQGRIQRTQRISSYIAARTACTF